MGRVWDTYSSANQFGGALGYANKLRRWVKFANKLMALQHGDLSRYASAFLAGSHFKPHGQMLIRLNRQN